MLQSRMNAAKIAYLNRAPLDGREVTADDLQQIAKDVIEANYELQRRRYGKVRLKLSQPSCPPGPLTCGRNTARCFVEPVD